MTASSFMTSNKQPPRPVGWWLITVAAVILIMMLWGTYTRRTDSGLSMVHWQPIAGILPPLSKPAWQAEFDHYKRSPQYRDVNEGMSLPAFERIFWVEYIHRLLGRIIALIFAVPLIYFFATRRIDKRLALKLFGIFSLGGLQGFLGWYMVESGLENVPAVSPYRLTAHLGLAAILYGLVLWVAFSLLAPARIGPSGRYSRLGSVVLSLIFLQILFGGLMSGFHAGLIDNTWPLMNGTLIPPHLFATRPVWLAPLSAPLTIQFDHRLLAYVIFALVALLWWRGGRDPQTLRARLGRHVLLAAALAQLLIGIFNLLLYVPVTLAVAHIGGAMVLLTAALYFVHTLRGQKLS